MVAKSSTLSGSNRAHIVVVPIPAPGHTIPFLHLSKQLALRDITITFVSNERHMQELQQSKDTHAILGGSEGRRFDIRFVGLKDDLPPGRLAFAEKTTDETMGRLMEELLSKMMESPCSDDIAAGSAPPPCCIVSDLYVGWTQDVANKFGIPRHIFYPSPAACIALMLQVPTLLSQGHLPWTSSSRLDLIFLHGLPPLHPLDLPSSFLAPEFSLLYEFIMRNARRVSEASIIVVNTFSELEVEALDALQNELLGTKNVQVESVLPVGPLLPAAFAFSNGANEKGTLANGITTNGSRATANGTLSPGTEQRHSCLQWLDTQPPASVVYISFGSMGTISATEVLELAQGLEASGKGFLWVLRPPEAPTAFLASTPPPATSEYLPPGFDLHTKERGLVVSGWVPQPEVLSHPATGGFLTHCGWNSILESVSSGVPLLTWPLFAEQRMNCRFLVDQAKVAVELHKGSNGIVDKDEVEQAVRILFGKEEGRFLRHNILKLRNLAHNAVAEGGSSHRNLKTFVEKIKMT